MKIVETTAKTVDEAVELALKELGAAREGVEVEVLEETFKGILGFIKVKPGQVKVILKEGPSQKACNLLKKIFRSMDLEVE